MSEPKWTPGPWKILPLVNEASDMDIYIGSEDAGTTACMMPGYKDHPHNIANANMAAAAPELYDALDGVIAAYANLVNSGGGAYWDPEQKTFIIEARAALAKARGEVAR